MTRPSEWRRLAPFTLVEVVWEDAESHGGDATLSEVCTYLPCLRYSSGYVVRADKEYVAIAQTDDRGTYMGRRSSGDDRPVCDTLVLPAAYVKNITVLQKAARR